MGTTRFVLRTDKPDKKGLCAIQIVYSISGQRKYFQTSLKLHSECWDADRQRAIYLDKKAAKKLEGVDPLQLLSSKETDELNDSLQKFRSEIKDLERKFELNRTVYSPAMVIAALASEHEPLTKKGATGDEVYKFIERYIEDHRTTREPGSLSVYNSLKNHLQHFAKAKNRKITFESIDYNFFQEFQTYLITTRGLNNTTVAKQLSTVKTFLNYARIQGIEVPLKYKDFKIKKESLEVVALTMQEFEQLYHMDLSHNRRLEQTRDVFCFACATGLRYSDLLQLRREHIKGDEIRLTVKKTKELLSIPLNPYSLAILEKYKHQLSPLPVISNQKLNDYLKGTERKGIITKGLCEIAGIDEPVEIVRFRGSKREATVYPKYKLIGVHTARKTFATLSLEKGMSAEEVMTITGHKDYKSFKRYVKVTEQRKKVVMRRAWGEIKLPEMKVAN